MYPASFDTFLATISAEPPAEKAKACFEEARSLRASAEELGERAEEICQKASDDTVLAYYLDQQALLFHAEVVGACKHLYGNSRDSQVMCEFPIDHEHGRHHVPGLDWGNPSQRIRRRCSYWPCLWRERWFDRFEATRDDGAKYWRYRDAKGHVDSFG